MKRGMVKISLIVFFILGLQTSVLGQGIPEGLDVPSFTIPNNQTWSFIKYGGSPGDLHTGTVGVSIPIFEYKDEDFTIPISLNYASGGYMPNRAIGMVGMGWYLNIGGTLTREVHGFPDDRNIRYEEGVSYLGFFSRQISEFNIVGMPLAEEWLIPGNHPVTFTRWAEAEHDPDTFHFSFMGHSGSFVGYGESVTCYNTSAPANEYKIITFTNLNTNKDWWENVQFQIPDNDPQNKLYEQDKLQTIYIITGDGLRYQFKALEKNERSMFTDDDIPLKMTWYLTKIYAPNGREVIFVYQQGREVIISNPKANNVSYSDTQPGVTTKGGSVSTVTYYPYFLSSIKIKENATYSDSDPRNRTLITLSYVEKEMISLVQKIKIHKDGNGLDKEYSFDHTVYGEGYDKVPFLTTLVAPIGYYKFKYLGTDAGSFHKNRGIACYDVDHWGFYNGKMNTDKLYIPTTTIDSYYNETITGTSRDPDFTMATRGMLETIHYPTGGKTVFEYEPHDYSKEVIRTNSSTPGQKPFYPQLVSIPGTPKITGGVRLKSIKDYDTGDSEYKLIKQKQYSYTESAGTKSSGILLKSPRYRIQYRIKGYRRVHFDTQFIDFNGLFNLADESFLPSTYDKTHIEYSEVKETNLDGSYTVHRFSDYQTIPDIMPGRFDIYDINTELQNSLWGTYMKISTTGYENGISYSSTMRDYVNNLLMEPMSMHMYRGKPKEISHYDNTGELVEKTDYYYWYEESRDPICQEYQVRAGDLIYLKKNPIETRPLVKTVVTRSGVVDQTEYEYNINGRLRKTSKLQSDGSYNVSITKYCDEVGGYYDLAKNHLLSLPVREETYAKGGLVSRLDYTYARTGTGTNFNYAVTEIKSKSFDPPRSAEVSSTELETEIKFEHDDKGKLKQSIDRNGKSTTYLWGYTNKYIIAIIENASFSQVQAVVRTTTISNMASNTPTDAEINSLWSQLKGASSLSASQINVATYRTHAGITSMTDPSGRKSYYEYDAQDRLISVKDENGNIIENYSYHFR